MAKSEAKKERYHVLVVHVFGLLEKRNNPKQQHGTAYAHVGNNPRSYGTACHDNFRDRETLIPT